MPRDIIELRADVFSENEIAHCFHLIIFPSLFKLSKYAPSKTAWRSRDLGRKTLEMMITRRGIEWTSHSFFFLGKSPISVMTLSYD